MTIATRACTCDRPQSLRSPDGLAGTALEQQTTGARRIALVFEDFAGGGVQRTMLRTADGLVGRGFAVDLVVARAAGPLHSEVSPQARIAEIPRSSLWRAGGYAVDDGTIFEALATSKKARKSMRYLPALVRYFRNEQPNAVLAATARYNLVALWARRLADLDAVVVVTQHDQSSDPALPPGLLRGGHPATLIRRDYLQADAIVAVSNGVADDLAACAGIPRSRITMVYNPVVGRHLAAKAQHALDHPWFAPGEPPVVLGGGRPDPQKDFATLIRAFVRVRAQRRVRLLILADLEDDQSHAEYAGKLRALPEELDVAEDVSFAGFVANPFAYMARAAVFVLSSVHEGLGNVLIEAMACGTPVVSTDCPSGPREILDHGRFGPLVPVGDDRAMAAAIAATLERPMAAAMLQGRAQMFSVDRAVDRYVDLMFHQD
jgi:glycosyltransferase involved in cell wall biosynthesis